METSWSTDVLSWIGGPVKDCVRGIESLEGQVEELGEKVRGIEVRVGDVEKLVGEQGAAIKAGGEERTKMTAAINKSAAVLQELLALQGLEISEAPPIKLRQRVSAAA